MSHNIFVIQLPANPKLPFKEITSQLFLTLPCDVVNLVTGEHTSLPNINAASVKSHDRIILLLASPDVSVFKLKVPPLSAANLELAAPALLEETLSTSFVNCTTVVCNELVENDGVRYAYIAVSDRSWIDGIKAYFSTLKCKTINIFPLYEIIPKEVSKCNFLINFDQSNSISWRSGIGAGGGAQLFVNQEGIRFNAYMDSVIRANQNQPKDVTIYSENISTSLPSYNTVSVKLVDLIKNQVLKNIDNKAVDFYKSRKSNSFKFNLKNINLSRFIIFVIMLFIINLSFFYAQNWKLENRRTALRSELIGKLSGKDIETVPPEKTNENFVKNAMTQLRYADGGNEYNDFVYLENFLDSLLRNKEQSSVAVITYKDTILYAALPETIDLKNLNTIDSKIKISKIKTGYWKLEKLSKQND